MGYNMNIENDIKLDFADVLIRPKRSTLGSRSQVDLIKKFKPKYSSNEFEGVPIIAANMATGTFEMLHTFIKHKMFVAIAKHNNDRWIDEYNKNPEIIHYGFYTIGMSDDELNKFKEFYEYVKHHLHLDKKIHHNKIKLIIDIANGYTQNFVTFVKRVRDEYPNIVIIAGNVATPEMVQELIINGADYVKIGIGPGSVCTTRKQTGIGYPQISAAIECSDAAHGLGAGIILDGGMRTPGDVAKAFCANSDMVMIGGMFAGTNECDGEVIYKHFENPEYHWINGDWKRKPSISKCYKKFYGMSSEYAQEQHGTGMKEYRSSEGRVEEVELIGPVEPIIMDLLGGLRSTGTYIGAEHIKYFGKCSTFIRVNRIHDKF